MDTAPTHNRLAIIADDLTGAADSGAPFARLGFSTVVVLDPAGGVPSSGPEAEGAGVDPTVVVLDTESRYLRPAEAAEAVAHAARLVRTLGPRVVYKKIDSLFRGNVATEIAAAMNAIGASECLLAPAFPEQGRTTEGGRCLVHGTPLPSGDIAAILESNAPGAFEVRLFEAGDLEGPGPSRFAGTLGSATGPRSGTRRLFLVDAWKQEHLEDLASRFFDTAASGNPILLAGSGGFAAAIAGVMARTAGREPAPSPGKQPAGPAATAGLVALPAAPAGGRGILVVSGSRSTEAARQLEELRSAAGTPVPVVTPADPPGAAGSRAHSQALEALAGGRIAVVATDPGPTIAGASGRVAAIAAEILASGARPRIVFVGGETAMAALRLIDARRITLLGELEPGVAYGRLPESRFGVLEIATKAGAFGDPETLLRLAERLTGA